MTTSKVRIISSDGHSPVSTARKPTFSRLRRYRVSRPLMLMTSTAHCFMASLPLARRFRNARARMVTPQARALSPGYLKRSAVVNFGSMSTGTAASRSSTFCTGGRTLPSRSISAFAFT